MGRRLVWRLKAARPLEVREPSTIRLLEVLDDQGRVLPGARVKILVEGGDRSAADVDAEEPATLRLTAGPDEPETGLLRRTG